jgi:hypothetical protein
VTVLAVVLGLVGAVFGFRAYAQSRYLASPHRPAIEILEEQAGPGTSIVTDDQFVYEQLYPFLHRHFRVILVETFDYLPPWAPRLEGVADQSAGKLWVYAQADSPLHSWLADRYPSLASYEFDGWRLSGWDTR